MKFSNQLGLTVILLLIGPCCDSLSQSPDFCFDSICHLQLTDTLYNSPQRINLVYLGKSSLQGFEIDIACQSAALLTTSQFAQKHGAMAAINGSFFDMDAGGSVGYLERNDSLISGTRTPGQKWAVTDSIMNAAIVQHRDSGLQVEYARPEKFYEESDKEDFVMVAGPLLIKDSIPQALPDMNFTHIRHPRTCLGITGESIIFITIDGRSELAAGMSLIEVRKFLLSLGCLDAINLDGGGSTSMWIRNRGTVNMPSDRTGERPVANALIIKKK
jgi:exopolysaccharide biosynthesis protein